MRIGILTFHYVTNFGAVLQSYALYTYLTNLGHTVYFIDFRPYRASALKRVISVDALRSLINISCDAPISFSHHLARRMNERIGLAQRLQSERDCDLLPIFDSFRERHFRMTNQRYLTLKDLKINPPECDAYVTGSDQVWSYLNPNLYRAYLLDFGSKNTRRISYAASFGKRELEPFLRKEYKKYLSRFNSISVREESGAQIVENICGIKATQVVDPTMLIDDYRSITSSIEVQKKFIFSFRLHQEDRLSDTFTDLIQRISKYIGLEVTTVTTSATLNRQIGNSVITGVEGFLSFCQESEMIVTNSFHGTVMAILSRKPFICFPRDSLGLVGQNERMVALLSSLGLMSRYLDPDENYDLKKILSSDIDWQAVFRKIGCLRVASEAYLTSALKA